MPDTVLNTGDTAVNKRDESPYPEGIYILVEGTDNSKNKLVEY